MEKKGCLRCYKYYKCLSSRKQLSLSEEILFSFALITNEKLQTNKQELYFVVFLQAHIFYAADYYI